MRRAPHDQSGMTLIELLVSITLLMLVVGPIVMVLQFAMSTAKATSQRTTDSAGAQLMTSYFAADVQSAAFVWSSSSPTPFTTAPFTARCGDASTRLELQWTDTVSGAVIATTYDAAAPVAPSTGDPALVRRTWTVTSGACSPASATRLVKTLNAGTLPVVACLPAACANATSVRMTVNALAQDVHNSSLYSAYAFDLTASRRAG